MAARIPEATTSDVRGHARSVATAHIRSRSRPMANAAVTSSVSAYAVTATVAT